MEILKKIFSIILSIIVFVMSLVMFSLLLLNIFLKTDVLSNVVDSILKEVDLNEVLLESDNENDNKLVLESYDDAGNYLGEYEIDISDVNLDKIEKVVTKYLQDVIEYLRNIDSDRASINLDGNLIKPLLIEEFNNIISQVEEREKIELDKSELEVEISKTIDELFSEINTSLNSDEFVEQIKSPVSFLNSISSNKRIIILLISDIIVMGLIFLINRKINAFVYIAVPMLLVGLLLSYIIFSFGFNLNLVSMYLIAILPILIGIGLIILYYSLLQKGK